MDDNIDKSIELIKEEDYYYENNKDNGLLIRNFFINSPSNSRNIVIGNNNLEINKDNNYYYYYDNNKIYKVLETNKKTSKLLLELEDIKEWKVYDNIIIIMQKDTIYTYTEREGLRKIVKSNELKYNYKNIYNIGKK